MELFIILCYRVGTTFTLILLNTIFLLKDKYPHMPMCSLKVSDWWWSATCMVIFQFIMTFHCLLFKCQLMYFLPYVKFCYLFSLNNKTWSSQKILSDILSYLPDCIVAGNKSDTCNT